MANRPHIPKFGDWSEQQNVPFTMVFDDASKKKRTGQSNIRNPNDPSENPALFSDHRSPLRPNRRTESGNQQIPSRDRHEQVKVNGGGGEFRQFAESPAQSEKSSRVKPQAAGPPNNRRYGGRVGNQTDVTGQPPSAPVPPRSPYNSSSRGSSTASDGRTTQIPNVRGQARKGRGIPQFGSWGYSNGGDEGFTQIFENARKEKNHDVGRPVIGTPSSTPSRPINGHRPSPPTSPKTCCFSFGGQRKH